MIAISTDTVLVCIGTKLVSVTNICYSGKVIFCVRAHDLSMHNLQVKYMFICCQGVF